MNQISLRSAAQHNSRVLLIVDCRNFQLNVVGRRSTEDFQQIVARGAARIANDRIGSCAIGGKNNVDFGRVSTGSVLIVVERRVSGPRCNGNRRACMFDGSIVIVQDDRIDVVAANENRVLENRNAIFQ